jgi:GT2 family glycosyltransferase
MIGVVTVTYNSGKVIRGFLDSLLRQYHNHFILYAIDNASCDDTLTIIGSYEDPRIEVTANQVNVGIAEANNQGTRAALAANCDYVLFLNNDTEFGPDLLSLLVQGAEQYSCDMAAPKILYHHNPQIIWSAGGSFDKRRGYSAFHLGYNQMDYGQFDTPCPVEHAPACCLLVRRHVFRRIGLMDERYFTYVEDTDFCFRAKRAGLSLLYCPSARLLHKAHSLAGGPLSTFMVRYITRNRVYFVLKHLGAWRGLYYVPAYQLHLLLQLLSRTVRPSMFWLREKAFFEGLGLWLRSGTTITQSNV